jgi:ribosomal protein S12 methylthiotransferase accessory factor
MTDKQAQVSALGEAFERYSISYHSDEPCVRGSHRSMGTSIVDLNTCLGFSERQYADRDNWNAELEGTRLHVVPRPIDEDEEIEWVRAWSLTNQRERWLASSFCYVGHPESQTHFFCSADSNGCAAGSSAEDAILRGFLELVERDAVAIWWYNRIRRPRVDAASFCAAYYSALEAHYATLDRDIWVLDLTTDLGIPTFAAVSRKQGGAAEDIILGCAAHLSPKKAMLHALSELNQFLPIFKQGPDGKVVYDFPDTEAINWWKTGLCKEEEYLLPGYACRSAADYADLETDDLLDDVRVCLRIAQKGDLEIVVVDQTRPEVDVPVWRVAVPGLRHFWRRLGPGRLYDVPVKLGWLDRPTREENMNRHSIFF